MRRCTYTSTLEKNMQALLNDDHQPLSNQTSKEKHQMNFPFMQVKISFQSKLYKFFR